MASTSGDAMNQMQGVRYALVLVVFATASAVPAQESPLDDLGPWIAKNYGSALDAVLPLTGEDVAAAWVACARVSGPSGPEVRVCLTREDDGDVRGTFSRLTGTALASQLRRIRTERPEARLDEIIQHIGVQSGALSGSSKEMESRARDLERLSVPVIASDALAMDDTTYELAVRMRWGSTMRASVSGSLKSHPVVRWMNTVLTQLPPLAPHSSRE